MKEKVELLTAEEERELHHVYADVTTKSPLVYRHVQRLLATLHAERARAAQIAEDRDAAWRDVEKLQTAYDAVQSGHGWCRCHDVLGPVLEERDELRSERDAINEERRLLLIELGYARHETCLCDHPHRECATCGCLILAAEQYESELSRVRKERDALAAQVAALSLAAQTMHDWCDDVQKDTEHPCDFMRPGYEPGDTIFRKLGEALALTPADAVARIEALEAVVRVAGAVADCFRQSAMHHDEMALIAQLNEALAHPALRTSRPASPETP